VTERYALCLAIGDYDQLAGRMLASKDRDGGNEARAQVISLVGLQPVEDGRQELGQEWLDLFATHA